MTAAPTVIGWREWATLPELGGTSIKAKVDTGARSSSLHAWDVEVIPGSSPPRLRFVLHPVEHDDTLAVQVEAPLVDARDVRSSNGEVERRPVVRTTLLVARRRFSIDLTLTRRDEMGFRMLLGRSAIRRRFMVDPDRSFLGGGSTVSPPASHRRFSAANQAETAGSVVGHPVRPLRREDRHPVPQSEPLLHLPAAGGG